jgi:hypothetical protein
MLFLFRKINSIFHECCIKVIQRYVFLFLGIPDRIEYTPGSGSRVLVPDAELQLCDVPCDTDNVSVRLALATHHIGKGCDRDTYSVESQRKLCGKLSPLFLYKYLCKCLLFTKYFCKFFALE